MIKHAVKIKGVWKETVEVYTPTATEGIKNILKFQVF
jgi:hypothetical protein